MILARKWIILLCLCCLQIQSVSLTWMQYNGMWYYFSEKNYRVNYHTAQKECAKLDGHLAAIVDNAQKHFLAWETGGEKRWIGLSTANVHSTSCTDGQEMGWAGDDNCILQERWEVKPQHTCSSAVIYTELNQQRNIEQIEAYRCTDAYGYVCQWQCRHLFVFSQNIPKLKGEYILQGYRNLRHYYTWSKNTTRLIEFNNETWSILDDDKEYAHKDLAEYVPYTRANTWINSMNSHRIDFVCTGCHTYEVQLTGHHISMTRILKKLSPFGTDYASTDGYTLSLYYAFEPLWRFVQNQTVLFTKGYAISPYVVHNFQFPTYIDIFADTVNVNIICETKFDKATSTPANIISTPTFTLQPSVKSSVQSEYVTHSTLKSYTLKKHTTSSTLSFLSIGYLTTSAEQPYTSEASTRRTTISKVMPNNTTMIDSSETLDKPFTTAGNTQVDETTTDQLATSRALISLTDENSNAIYIGVSFAIVILVLIAICVTIFCYKRRLNSRKQSLQATEHLHDIHIATDPNVNPENEYAEIAPNMRTSNYTSNLEGQVNPPDVDTYSIPVSVNKRNILTHDILAANSKQPTCNEFPVSTDVKQKSQKSIEHLYSQVNKNVHGNVNISQQSISALNKCATSDCSEEEFNDNEIYEGRKISPIDDQLISKDKSSGDVENRNQSTQAVVPAKATVFDNVVFLDDDEDEEIEMYDNDIYGQHI